MMAGVRDAEKRRLYRAAGEADDLAEVLVSDIARVDEFEMEQIAKETDGFVQVGDREAGVMCADDTRHSFPSASTKTRLLRRLGSPDADTHAGDYHADADYRAEEHDRYGPPRGLDAWHAHDRRALCLHLHLVVGHKSAGSNGG